MNWELLFRDVSMLFNDRVKTFERYKIDRNQVLADIMNKRITLRDFDILCKYLRLNPNLYLATNYFGSKDSIHEKLIQIQSLVEEVKLMADLSENERKS